MRRTLNSLLALALLSTLALSCSDSDDDATNNSPVLGTWRVLEVLVSDQTLTQRSPSDETISVTFEAGGNFTGNTSVNSFDGRYELNQSTLTMLEFTTTEVADTPFAGVFYEAIAEAIVPNSTQAQFGFSFENQNLILVFGNSGQMVLEAQ